MVAAPLLLARETPGTIVTVFSVGIVGLLAGYLLGGGDLPIIARLGELDNPTSSGSDRMIVPATWLVGLIRDPAFFLLGKALGHDRESIRQQCVADAQADLRIRRVDDDPLHHPLHIGGDPRSIEHRLESGRHLHVPVYRWLLGERDVDHLYGACVSE